jgi:small ligand-binding sensory domain FIST
MATSIPGPCVTTALATSTAGGDCAERLVAQIQAGLTGQPADLCFLFASAHFEDQLASLAERVYERLGTRALAGLTAEGIICGDREYESQPALVVWAARLPGTRVLSFHLSEEDVEQLDTPELLREHLGVPADAQPSFVLLAEPFSFSATPGLLNLLERLDSAYPGCQVLGGLASAGEEPGQNRIIFDGHTLRHGLVGVAVWGGTRVDAVVSQGCRPIGKAKVVTRADGNVIYELGGQAPLEVVKQLLVEVAPQDRRLLRRRGLLLGCVANEYQQKFARGDFVIRNPLGFDPNSGAMAVNDLIRIGQTVQFHVRDEASASEDLEGLLAARHSRPAVGALLFTCNGRGTRMFREHSHDARAIHAACGDLPVAGFFAAGEIGPVGRRTFVHGFTASIGFFGPREPRADD